VLICASLAGDAGNEPEGEADDMASPVRPSITPRNGDARRDTLY